MKKILFVLAIVTTSFTAKAGVSQVCEELIMGSAFVSHYEYSCSGSFNISPDVNHATGQGCRINGDNFKDIKKSLSIHQEKLKKVSAKQFCNQGADTYNGMVMKIKPLALTRHKYNSKKIETSETVTIASTATTPEQLEFLRYKAKNAMDETDKQLNIIWKSTVKSVRKSLLAKQRKWLKHRKKECIAKATSEGTNNIIVQEAINFNCRAEMTAKRNKELKIEIEDLLEGY